MFQTTNQTLKSLNGPFFELWGIHPRVSAPLLNRCYCRSPCRWVADGYRSTCDDIGSKNSWEEDLSTLFLYTHERNQIISHLSSSRSIHLSKKECINEWRRELLCAILRKRTSSAFFFRESSRWEISKEIWWEMRPSIDWFKGKITGSSHISWENLWFPIDFPLSQPLEKCYHGCIMKILSAIDSWCHDFKATTGDPLHSFKSVWCSPGEPTQTCWRHTL